MNCTLKMDIFMNILPKQNLYKMRKTNHKINDNDKTIRDNQAYFFKK